MEKLNNFIHDAYRLKRKDRAGWVRRGIENPESVAEHSFGVALIALVLSEKFGLDSNRAVKMGLIHDLAEYSVPDFTPFDNVPQEKKFRLEEEAMKKLCSELENGDEILTLWYELEKGESPEAQFIKRLDKLEMMFQAKEYAQEQPEKDLELFWEMIEDFEFGELGEIFNKLKAERDKNSEQTNF